MPTLVFDCETTGLDSSARPIQLGWVILNDEGVEEEAHEYLMKTVTDVPVAASNIHGITTEQLFEQGVDPVTVLNAFGMARSQIRAGGGRLVSHNAVFDVKMLRRVYSDYGIEEGVIQLGEVFCTMRESTARCQLGPRRYNTYKWPKLQELADTLGLEYDVTALHGALADARLTARAYTAGGQRGWW